MKKGVMLAAGSVLGVTALGLLSVGLGGISAADSGTRATLRDPAGVKVGTVSFANNRGATEVRVELKVDPAKVATNAFHGMHIHANGDHSNGDGCVADATKEAATWFVSADGHWKADGQDHSGHHGDLMSVFVNADGTASTRYTISRVDRSALSGKALILHALADNFGNVPVGSAANQYTANSAEATTATKNTGNAGLRVACGVVGER